jgi:YggT family protein
MIEILCRAIDIYILLFIVRMVLSFFPMSSDGPVAQIARVLSSITEPLLAPLRRVIPPIGGAFDLSPLIVLIGLRVFQGVVLRC